MTLATWIVRGTLMAIGYVVIRELIKRRRAARIYQTVPCLRCWQPHEVHAADLQEWCAKCRNAYRAGAQNQVTDPRHRLADRVRTRTSLLRVPHQARRFP
jgi:hypothetical protein